MTPELWGLTISGVLALIGVLYGAYRAGKTTVKVKELDVDGKAFERAEQIYDGAIATLQRQYADLVTAREADKTAHALELAKRDERLDRVEKEVRTVRDQNNALVTFVYKMLAILRSHNLTDQINLADVPDGIHI
ncbi:membrane protein [Arthrobacter phage Vibaki]|uniref:Membrane protein n=1 Tax=Arthrobacter phage Vibaki TaxID=2593333 RepID=A0A514TYY9_9CAUD|nr:membrane protein [Arthrobacter phage Vibaki]QDK01907.1 membrane protein [Arthrobacter phage Vibaki]